jgi:hypothetical protein
MTRFRRGEARTRRECHEQELGHRSDGLGHRAGGRRRHHEVRRLGEDFWIRYPQAGIILLLVGIGVFVVSLLILALGGRSRSTVRTDVRETPSGQQQTEQKDDWSTS